MNQDLFFTDVQIRNLSSFPDLNNLKLRIQEQSGIENATFNHGRVHIEYYPSAISLNGVNETIVNLGCIVDLHKKEKNSLKRFINHLGESNQKTFGSKELNCCDLNTHKETGTH